MNEGFSFISNLTHTNLTHIHMQQTKSMVHDKLPSLVRNKFGKSKTNTSIFKHVPQPEQSQLASHTTIKNQNEIKQVTNIQNHN